MLTALGCKVEPVPPISITFSAPSSTESAPPSPHSTCSSFSGGSGSPDYVAKARHFARQRSTPSPKLLALGRRFTIDSSPLFPLSSTTALDFDDTSHTDENDIVEAERRSGFGMDGPDFAMVGRRKRRQDSHHSDTDSDADELRSLDDFPVETNYVMQHEEEFGSVFASVYSASFCFCVVILSRCAVVVRGAHRGVGRRQQESHMVFGETSPSRNGSVQSGASHIHP